MIKLDGAIGGGSVLRVAVPLAISQGMAIEVFNIRQNRPKPGLRTQHLLGLQILADITNSQLIGAYIGSTEIKIIPPEKIEPLHVNYNIKIDTAASITLIFQILSNLLFGVGGDIKLQFLGGGTHTRWAPNTDYLKYVVKPIFSQLNQKISIDLERYAYYPRGGALGNFHITQNNFSFDLNTDCENHVISRASYDLKHARVADRQLDAFLSNIDVNFNTYTYYDNTASTGSAITAAFGKIPRGISILGKQGLSSEKIGNILSQQVKELIQKNTDVDEFMADQLILPLSLSTEGSYTAPKMTDHIRTNLYIVNKLFGDIVKVVGTSPIKIYHK